MSEQNEIVCQREFDFALVISGVAELTEEIENKLFDAGCDDSTLSIRYGLLYIEFSRNAASLKEAILSAINDVRRAGIGAEVMNVDECSFVTASEIARKINKSRQLVGQYISGGRGPGGFPPPAFHLHDEGAPLWSWCEVSFWLAQNDMLRREIGWDAEAVAAINNWLEAERHRGRSPDLFAEINRRLLDTSDRAPPSACPRCEAITNS